jgi:hypothetical protein
VRVDCALLADAATVREGLLHILGGGLSYANRTEFPAPMLMCVGLRILVHPTEIESVHVVRVIVLDADGHQIDEATMGFNPPPEEVRAAAVPGEEWSLPLALNLYGVQLPHAGGYSVEVLIDNNHHASLGFRAQTPPVQGGTAA